MWKNDLHKLNEEYSWVIEMFTDSPADLVGGVVTNVLAEPFDDRIVIMFTTYNGARIAFFGATSGYDDVPEFHMYVPQTLSGLVDMLGLNTLEKLGLVRSDKAQEIASRLKKIEYAQRLDAARMAYEMARDNINKLEGK